MIAWNGDNLAGIATVGPIETLAIVIFFSGAINDIAQVKQKGRIESTRACLKIACHLLGNLLGHVSVIYTGVAQSLKTELAEIGYFTGTGRTNDVAQLHDAVAFNRRHRAQLRLAPLRYPVKAVDRLAGLRRNRQIEWMRIPSPGI